MDNIVPKDKFILEFEKLSKEDILKVDKRSKKIELNAKRAQELKVFVIDDIFMNEDIIKTMSVQLNIASDTQTIEWINIHNEKLQFRKAKFALLIKQGSQKIKEIYFKYRDLKDKLDLEKPDISK